MNIFDDWMSLLRPFESMYEFFFIDAFVFDDFLNALFGEIVHGKGHIERVFLQYVSSYAFSNHEIVYRIAHMVSSCSIVLLVVPMK